MTKSARQNNLLPNGVPKWVRCYDNGGKSTDRYTVQFCGHIRNKCDGQFPYLAMSASPFHPQGVGIHGSFPDTIDTNNWGFAPMVGRRNHLGKRINFHDLPADCQKLVMRNYKEIWKLSDVVEQPRVTEQEFEEYVTNTFPVH